MTTITLAEQLTCVRRELAMRERCYPRWIEGGRMKREVAARELERMRAVLETLEAMAVAESARAQSFLF